MDKPKFLKIFFRLLAAVSCIASTAAVAGGLTLVHPFRENTEGEQWARNFADCVSQSSSIPVEVLPGHYFGRLREISKAVSSGKLDMAILPSSIIAEDWPALDLYAVPGLLRDPNEIDRLSTDTDILETIDELGSRELGMFVLGFGWQYQLLALTAAPDRLNSADGRLDGLKIRAFGERQTDFFARLGALPIRLPTSEVPYAVLAGAVDGAVMSLDQIFLLSQERQISSLFWPNKSSPFLLPFAVVVSTYADSSWSKLQGEEIRFGIRENCADVVNGFNQVSFEAAAELVDKMRSQDIRIVEDNLVQWYEVGASLLEDFAGKADAMPLYGKLKSD